MTIITKTDDFILYVEVEPVELVAGHHCVTLRTQWLTAKNPDERRTKASFTCDRPGLEALRATITRCLDVAQPRGELK